MDSVNSIKRKTEDLYASIIVELCEDLNIFHKINWNQHQYEKLLGNWLINFIQIIYERFHNCSKYSVDPDKCIPWVPSSIIDIIKLGTSKRINSNVCNDITLLKLGASLAHENMLPEYSDHVLQSFTFQKGDYPIQLHGAYINLKQSVKDLDYRSHLETKELQFKPFAGHLCLKEGIKNKVKLNWKWRIGNQSLENSSLSNILRVMIRRYIPVCFLEGFKTLYESAKPINTKYIFSSTSIHNNLGFKFLTARNPEVKVLCNQHGGGYGIDSYCNSETYERKVSDILYTWGWTEDQKTKPLPNAPAIDASTNYRSNCILFKYVLYPKYFYKLDNYPFGNRMNNYLHQLIQFAQKVQNLKIEISHYPHDYGWNIRKRLSDADVEIDEKSMDDGKYQLHVCNYLGTSWLESIAANLPVICFYDPEINKFRDSVSPYIKSFERLGILHHCPHSAADKVIEVSENPEKWWQSDDVQSNVSNFREKYARLEDGWEQIWREEFSSLSKN